MTMRKDIKKVGHELTTMTEGVAQLQTRDKCKHPTWLTMRVL